MNTINNNTWNKDLDRIHESSYIKHKKNKKVKFYHQMIEIGGDHDIRQPSLDNSMTGGTQIYN